MIPVPRKLIINRNCFTCDTDKKQSLQCSPLIVSGFGGGSAEYSVVGFGEIEPKLCPDCVLRYYYRNLIIIAMVLASIFFVFPGIVLITVHEPHEEPDLCLILLGIFILSSGVAWVAYTVILYVNLKAKRHLSAREFLRYCKAKGLPEQICYGNFSWLLVRRTLSKQPYLRSIVREGAATAKRDIYCVGPPSPDSFLVKLSPPQGKGFWDRN